MTTTRYSTAALHLDYLCPGEIAAQPPHWWQNVLGVVGFDRLPPIAISSRVPVAASMTPALCANDAALCEVWRVGGAGDAIADGAARRGRVHYRLCKEFLFGSLAIDESSIGPEIPVPGEGGADAAALLRATEIAYQEIFGLLRETVHPHLVRIWNYVPDINRKAGGAERYRLFNSARQLAFRNSGQATVGTVPAASALGSPAGSPLSIYFLAARRPPTMVENPRQTSAYHYPSKFGRHSPIFSRACVLQESTGTNLFISGTASIVGYESLHPGDVEAQTRETVANISALLAEVNRVGSARYSLGSLKLKIYVRRPSDLGAIKEALTGAARVSTPVVYLQADVCREDLLMEIEATGEPDRQESTR